ncbi:MAG: dephospho-CoA kinase [Thomasclavelia spiroformis]
MFNDKEAKADLEKIIHPYVISRIKKEIEDNRDLKYIFLDIPLLYESKLEYLCDKVIVVYLSLEDELKRLMERDQIDKEYAKLIIANQMSIESKKVKADIILDNSGSLENLYNQIEELLKGR